MKIIIVGLGKVGYAIAQTDGQLEQLGKDFDEVPNAIAIKKGDSQTTAAVIEHADATLDAMCVEGNGACASVLLRAGVRDADLVIVHDGARPLVGADLIGRCLAACSAADAVMPAIAVKDTTYLSDDGTTITALLDRSKLWAGQAPEAFRLAKYLAAHRAMDAAELMKINGSTELAFKSGLSCRIIEGDPMNFKITTPEDLSNFKTIIKARKK